MGRSYMARAQKAVEEGTWLELAWEQVANHTFVEQLYQTAAKGDPELSLAFERFGSIRGDRPRSKEPFFGAPQTRLGPLFVSSLYDGGCKQISDLLLRGVDLGEAVAPRLEGSKDKDALLPVLAGSPYPEDRDVATSYLDKAPPKPASYRWSGRDVDQFQMAAALAGQNDPRGDSILTRTLEEMTADAYVPEEEDGWERLMEALANRVESPQASQWVGLLVRGLHRGIEIFSTLRAFFDAGHQGESRAAIEAFASGLIDGQPHTRIRRVGLELLWAEERRPSLDDARWIRSYLPPQPYGWPKKEQLPLVHRLCGELFLRAGNDEEKRWVAGFSCSPFSALHALGDRARRQLGLPAVAREMVDEARVRAWVEAEDAEGLLRMMDTERAVWDSSSHYQAMNYLEERCEDDEALRERLIRWARKKVEGQPNYSIARYDMAPPDTCYALGFLMELSPELREAHLSGSESLWIRQECLGQPVEFPTPPPDPRPEGIEVQALCATPFAYTAQINGMALSPNGDKLAVVGDGGGRVFSLPDGELLLALQAGGWGYDCAFTPDGQQLVACFHGGHVWFFDMETGAMTQKLEGHPGVPDGVRCLALHPKGHRLVSGDSNGGLILWDLEHGQMLWRQSVKGCFVDVLFLPDDRVIASFSHENERGTKRNAILLVEADGETTHAVKCEFPIWAMALNEGGQLALGGEGGTLLLGAWNKKRFVEELRIETAELSDITRLAWQRERLWLCSQSGAIAHVDVALEELHCVETELLSLWGMACGDEIVYVGGKEGQVGRVEGLELLEAPVSHDDRLVGLLELSDGTLLSLDRTGALLRWPGGEGPPLWLGYFGPAADSLVAFDDDAVLCASSAGLSLVHAQSGELLASLQQERGSGVASAFDDQLAFVSEKKQIEFAKLPSLEIIEGSGIEFRARSMANNASGLSLLLGSEQGLFARWQGGQWLWQRADHGRDRFEKGNPHKKVCSVAFSPDEKLAVSGATDRVVRVYDASDGRPLLRFQCRFGLYNRLSIDATSRWLAIPDDRNLYLVDLQQRLLFATLPAQEFAQSAVLTAHFLRDGSLIASNAAGSLFRVTLPPELNSGT